MSDEVTSVLPPSRRQHAETDSGNVRESPQIDVGDLNMPLLFCRAGVVVVKRLRGTRFRSEILVVGHSTPLRGIECPTTAFGHLGD